jgi:hypothetical protein
VDVASLTGNRDSLLVHRSFLPVKVENALRVGEVAAVEEVAADHDARSAFSGLAVHGRHVALVLRQPRVHVFAEGADQRKVGRVVIVERVMLKKKSNISN